MAAAYPSLPPSRPQYKFDPPPPHDALLDAEPARGAARATPQREATRRRQSRALDTWVQMRVRLWASARCQTLQRTCHGLAEMREALVDLGVCELKCMHPHPEAIFLEDVHPSDRSEPPAVHAWLCAKGFGPDPAAAWQRAFREHGLTWPRLQA